MKEDEKVQEQENDWGNPLQKEDQHLQCDPKYDGSVLNTDTTPGLGLMLPLGEADKLAGGDMLPADEKCKMVPLSI